MKKIDLAIELGKKIALLREELAHAEQEMLALLTPEKTERTETRIHVPGARTLRGSVAERVRAFVAANPGKPIPVSEIIVAHNPVDAATIRSTVHRLATGGMEGFKAVGHGMYRYDHEMPLTGCTNHIEARS